MRLLVATHNAGKRREFAALLGPWKGELLFPDMLGLRLEVVEDGTTYAENALKKARAYARAANMLALADDSGLEVDALGGAPGVHSARYVAGSDRARVEALLEALTGVPWERRSARFRCVVAMVSPDGVWETAEGVCEGAIAFEPAGDGGFGYDPVFFLPEYGCTMAQLPPETKNRISHRARAIRAALPVLERLACRG
jgi:XTP/dITP diphosphohydrolase